MLRSNRERDIEMSWHRAAQSYLERLATAEYMAARAVHVRAGRAASTYRYSPSEYHRELVGLLGKDDEHGFKALKMEQGYACAIGV